MNINLSWDLFIIVFFVVIVAYSLIIGRDSTLKVILGTYVAALSADAGGSLFAKYFAGSEAFVNLLKFAQLGTEYEAVIFVKVLLFVALVILFAVKGSFFVETADDSSSIIRMVLSVVYAIMSAGLVISIILVFVSGVSFIGGGNSQTTGAALWEVYSQSQLVRSMISNSHVWFAVPALSFLIHSLYSGGKE